jgi:hypothetical protein
LLYWLAIRLPVIYAQDMEAIAREAEQVTNDFQAGKITLSCRIIKSCFFTVPLCEIPDSVGQV